ncbi:MAG TPA: 16S rRNA (guanine(527)-N(7))-methyltransferase RsmG [Solirubrobacteraceae bacterium]|jgi:16S rRNA (guanine527-N7)-methyltransferase|nr:16S rRNA (guanine(527)-N(7))-methyltransferase RsmG [Solirubrobacteraceae bacterium]
MSPADADLERLIADHGLGAGALEPLTALLDSLAEDDRAPTAVRERRRVLDDHLADSLAGLAVAVPDDAGAIVDIGSGAGLPGLVAAVARPRARVTLVESQFRKCAFIEVVARRMGIGNAVVHCGRIEEWREGLGAADAVLARALGPQPVVLEYAAPVLGIGGVLADWRGRRNPAEEAAAGRAAALLGLRLREIRSVEPFSGARDRHVHVFEKTTATPGHLPRRAGAARKRPLG